MPRIDSHQHFWKFDPVRDSWITEDEMAAIRRDFMPADLQPLLQKNQFDGCVTVQTSQSEDDNRFMLGLAQENDFIKGIVGWVDLKADNIEERLEYYKQFPMIKGFRHVLQSEPDEQFMLSDSFKRGIQALQKHNYSYDLLIYPNHLKYAEQLVSEFPNQRFVIDHIAKANIRDKRIEEWKNDLQAIAKHPNVYCKVSGMLTEADWHAWLTADFRPYLDVVFNTFGTGRLMYGSDWPVCQLAGGYKRWIEIIEVYTSHLTQTEQDKFWGDNAVKFYDLKLS